MCVFSVLLHIELIPLPTYYCCCSVLTVLYRTVLYCIVCGIGVFNPRSFVQSQKVELCEWSSMDGFVVSRERALW